VLGRYLPDAHGEYETLAPDGDADECGMHLSRGGGLDFFVALSGDEAGAKQSVDDYLRLEPGHPDWTMHPLAGIGDQAVGFTAADDCAHGDVAQLKARYENVVIEVHDCRNQPLPDSGQELTAISAITRDFIANLAKTPATPGPAPAVIPSSAAAATGPSYAGMPAACDLIQAATVATFLGTAPRPDPGTDECQWTVPGPDRTMTGWRDVVLTPDGPARARQIFDQYTQPVLLGGGLKSAVSQFVPGLGDEAVAQFEVFGAVKDTPPQASATMYVRSGNAVFWVGYSVAPPDDAPPRAVQLAAITAAAKDALAALTPYLAS
jgi:hypothetical protein